MRVRSLLTAALAVLLLAGCSKAGPPPGPYGAQAARLGDKISVLGWTLSVSNLRWQADRVLVDVTGRADGDHARADDLRFGLYGTPLHPIEANGIGSCDPLLALTSTPLSTPEPDRLSGTVCLGPLKEQSAVRGIYLYSPAEKIKDTTVAYGAPFPVGLPPANDTDTGLNLTTQGLAAFRADGTPLIPASLGDSKAFTGQGFMQITLAVDATAERYRTESAKRGGPLMLVAGPSAPMADLSEDCRAAGSSVLILPEASLNAVHVATSLCTHGEINAAVLYASVSVIGTRAAVWTQR